MVWKNLIRADEQLYSAPANQDVGSGGLQGNPRGEISAPSGGGVGGVKWGGEWGGGCKRGLRQGYSNVKGNGNPRRFYGVRTFALGEHKGPKSRGKRT